MVVLDQEKSVPHRGTIGKLLVKDNKNGKEDAFHLRNLMLRTILHEEELGQVVSLEPITQRNLNNLHLVMCYCLEFKFQ